MRLISYFSGINLYIMKNTLLLLLLFAGLSLTDEANAQTLLSPDAFEKMLKNDPNIQLVDVRTPEEFSDGHIQKAVNYDYYAADFAQKIVQLDKTKPVLVYCEAGARSASSAEKLKKAGFKKIYDLDGGMSAWREAGKKVVN